VASLNATGRGIDDVYASVSQPQPVLANGGSSFQGAGVGMACWGPLNTPLSANTPQDLLALFGPPINSGRDLVQDGVLFLKQLPQGGFVGVRVSDGTDVAATAVLMDSAGTPAAGLDLAAKYTGTFGNSIKVTLSKGSNYSVSVPTWKIVVQAGSATPEVWDRIPGATGAAAWPAMLAAINNGQGANAPASKFVIASLPVTPSTLLPPTTAEAVTLTAGANGTTVTTSAQIGVDGGSGTRTGLYALRGAGMDVVWLCGNTDATSWPTLLAFAKSETSIGIGSLPAATTVASAVAAKLTAGIDDPYFILLLSEVTYLDTNLNTNVTLPATPVVAGLICSIAPHQSPGNRPVYGILGTEQSLGPAPQPFSRDDMNQLEANGINFVANPIPSANAFGLRHGKNTSSNFATSEIPYGRKTNSLVRAFSGTVMGQFINRLQTVRADDPLRNAVLAAFNDYLGPQKAALEIDNYDVRCDLTNNSPANIRSGLLRADVIVEYLSVVDQFIISLTAGQTVDVVAASAASTQLQ